MFSLFIDTHFKNINLALYKDSNLIDVITFVDASSTSECTMPLIIKLLNKNKISINKISRFFICNGPGSFTGIRIGVTLGKVLAYINKAEVFLIDSLSLIAFNKNNSTYYGVKENNGAYIAHFSNGKLDSEISYIKNKDLDVFCLLNNVFFDDKVCFDLLLKDISIFNKSDYFNANPCYVKNIEALNDKKN